MLFWIINVFLSRIFLSLRPQHHSSLRAVLRPLVTGIFTIGGSAKFSDMTAVSLSLATLDDLL
jgi:hypothetical protein